MTDESITLLATEATKAVLRAYFGNPTLFDKKFGHNAKQQAVIAVMRQHLIDALNIAEIQVGPAETTASIDAPIQTDTAIPVPVADDIHAATPVPFVPFDADEPIAAEG
jgi:hypothetical protein